jgi:hypothetical protein
MIFTTIARSALEYALSVATCLNQGGRIRKQRRILADI